MPIIEIKNYDKVAAYLIEVSERCSESSINKFLKEGGEMAVGDAQSRAPYDTGKLHDSINFTATGSEGHFRADAPYAGYVEYGTSKRPPIPFMRPAAVNLAAWIYGALEQYIATGTYEKPTASGSSGNKGGRPRSLSAYERSLRGASKEPRNNAGRPMYISKYKSPSGQYVYNYGDRPRLKRARVKTTDVKRRTFSRSNRGN